MQLQNRHMGQSHTSGMLSMQQSHYMLQVNPKPYKRTNDNGAIDIWK